MRNKRFLGWVRRMTPIYLLVGMSFWGSVAQGQDEATAPTGAPPLPTDLPPETPLDAPPMPEDTKASVPGSGATAPAADGTSLGKDPTATPDATKGGAPAASDQAAGGPDAALVLKNTRVFDDYDRPSGLGFSLYLGLDAGYGDSASAREVQESEKRGYQAALRLTPTITSGRIDYNFSLGYMFSFMKAQDKDAEHLLGSSDNKRIRGTSVEERLGFLTINPMVALSPSWSIGPMGMWLFGTDATFSAKVGKDEQTVFGGLNLYYHRSDSRYLYRYGFQYLVDVNIDQRRIQMFNFSAEIGMPLLRRKTVVEASEYEKHLELVDRKTVEKPVETVALKEDLSFVISAQYINFVTAKAELTSLSRTRLTRLGQYLAQNPGMWTGLTIEGHTDKRGSKAYNQKLSVARAKSVVDALVAAGAPGERIVAKGYGFERPLDRGNTPVALALNRRVEFRFDGVRDEGQLQSQLFRTLRSD